MKKKLMNAVGKLQKLTLFAFVLSMLVVTQKMYGQTITTNTTGTNNGWYYSFWNENSGGSASMTLGSAGNYSTTWSNIGNFTAGKGWATGKADRVICFNGTFDGGSNGFYAIYGWTKNDLIEYYVVESYGQWTPPGNTSDIEKMGSFTSDGGTYNIFRSKRTNKPSIIGTATFYQYWSVRTTKRTSGTVTFANHVAEWKKHGMNLGTTWDYQILETEGYGSSGSSNTTISECVSGPSVSISAPANNATVPVGSSVTVTADASVPSGSSITKVEFYNGTTLIGSDATSPYSVTWTTPSTAGTYILTAKLTDNSSKVTTSVNDTIILIQPFKIYKTPTAITIDGTVDAIWNDASVLPATLSKTLTGTISNASDLSGKFKALWDDTYLYILADVTDDTQKNDSQNSYDDDAIEVYIDGDNAKATTYDANDVQYAFGWNDGTTIGALPSGRSTTGITYSAVNKTGGYIVEARIPWTTLQVTPKGGKIIGVDFMINDDDDGSGRDAKLSWNAAKDDAWEDASLFGIATLSDLLSNPCTVPPAPSVVSPVNYDLGATATQFTATGTNLLWYSASTGGTGSSTAPTPSTGTEGTKSYFVSQTVNGCESPRSEIVVIVTKPAITISLKAGWNLIGCPLTGSNDINKALSSIWSEVVTVKNLDSFWDINSSAALNSLTKLEWGRGYYVKVKSACKLDWIVR